MPVTNDIVYQVQRIEHDEVSPDSIIDAVALCVRALEADSERRGYALGWNDSVVRVEGIQFGPNPDHEVRVTARVL